MENTLLQAFSNMVVLKMIGSKDGWVYELQKITIVYQLLLLHHIGAVVKNTSEHGLTTFQSAVDCVYNGPLLPQPKAS